MAEEELIEAQREIAEHPLTEAMSMHALKLIEKCKYTTTALLALAEALDALEDSGGAQQLRLWADEFREYEAATL